MSRAEGPAPGREGWGTPSAAARFGVVVFPGSNCDADCFWALEHLGYRVRYVWHQDSDLEDLDCVVLPGGFAYGDHLRAGAIARFSPVMQAVGRFARDGGLVLGICNGFQVLLEAGLLPGAMLANSGLRFICRYVFLRVENASTPFTRLCRPGQVLRIPIAHYQGNYYAGPATLSELERRGQVVLRYCDEEGRVTPESNPNGSLGGIAAVANPGFNVMGLMPHPERACLAELGSTDGRLILMSAAEEAVRRRRAPQAAAAAGPPDASAGAGAGPAGAAGTAPPGAGR
ncbi:MAG: phosphoribosylformylglycinamidine synthase subunit PurQ [Acetobacteraceae bacterium]|nr:phosphoribosylformylglycinamidine synthase subunit PurQ [Acetobacteraceae bacterium]